MACSSGCSTPGAHASWGECIRAKSLQVAPANVEPRRRWDAGLTAYQDLRRQGIQPQMPTWNSVEKAKRELGV